MMAKFFSTLIEKQHLVITVFLHGTCSDDHDHELISLLREHIENPWFVDEEGVGSTEYNSVMHSPKDSYSYFLREWIGHLFRHGDDNYFEFEQVAFGYGVKESIDDVVNRIMTIKKHHTGKFQTMHINTIGWSRGAASIFELANAIQDDINIFAVDPVPGFASSNLSNTRLNKNVKKCIWISAKNEHSFGFAPIYPKLLSSQIQFFSAVFPGHHATLVGNPGWRLQKTEEKLGKIYVPEVGEIVRWLAVQFLTENGTKFKDSFNWQLTPNELAEKFVKIKQDDDAGLYKKFEQETYTWTELRAKFFNAARAVIIKSGMSFNQVFSDIPALKTDLEEKKYVNRLHQYLEKNHYMNINQFIV